MLTTWLTKRLGCLSCMVPSDHYPRLSMEEILFRAEVVVWGKDIGHFTTKGDIPQENAHFEVYCAFKDGGMNIPHNITIADASPSNACKGESLTPGTEYLICLRRQADHFQVHYLETNPLQFVSFHPSEETLALASNVCGLQNIKSYHKSDKTCPKTTVGFNQCFQFYKTETTNVHTITPSSTVNIVTTRPKVHKMGDKEAQKEAENNRSSHHQSYQIFVIIFIASFFHSSY